MKSVKKLILLITTLVIGTGFVVNKFQNYGQETAQLDKFKDWSDYGLDFKIAKPNYEENSKELPKHISDQIEQDQQKGIKSFSQDALPFKYFDEQQRETFFWVKDEQIKNSKGQTVVWYDRINKKQGNKIILTDEQINKVKKALSYEKQRLTKQGWYQTKKSKYSWDFYQKHLGKFLTLKEVIDGDTFKFDGLKGLEILEPTKKITKTEKDNIRALVVDTDETNWMRYKNNTAIDDYLPTRLGYVQKAVAQAVKEIYKDQKWFVVPVAVDMYNRTVGLLFSPDGIPWHKFLCEFYGAAIYNKAFLNLKKDFAKRQNYLMAQWWMVDFWQNRASSIPNPKDKGYQQSAA